MAKRLRILEVNVGSGAAAQQKCISAHEEATLSPAKSMAIIPNGLL